MTELLLVTLVLLLVFELGLLDGVDGVPVELQLAEE